MRWFGALMALWLGACSGGPSGPRADRGAIALRVEYAGAAAKAAGAQQVERMVATVFQGVNLVLQRDLTRRGSRWQGELAVAAGQYTVRLEAYAGGGISWFGETDVAVRGGARSVAAIVLQQLYILQLSRESLDMGAATGDTSFALVNGGTADDLRWTIEERADWLEVQVLGTGARSVNGIVSGQGDERLRVVVDRTGLGAGRHDAVLRVSSNGGDRAVEVRITVEAPPAVEGPPDDDPAAGQALLAALPGGAEMRFVWVPAGSFPMGSPDSETGRSANEGPQHRVAISRGFYLGAFEVTQEQWAAVMGDNPGRFAGAGRPVETISWFDAQDLLRRLNRAAGDSLYRLPSEAEWEYAARAGSSGRWSFGDDERDLAAYAWYGDGEETSPVGAKAPNAWGLYDMHGNVWEWVQDWYGADYYANSPASDPRGPSTGTTRVLRGGAYNREAQFLRSADRLRFDPSVRSADIGVRLLRIK